MNNLLRILLSCFILISCSNDCDHCTGISRNIKESKKLGVFLKKSRLNLKEIVSPDFKDTIEFGNCYIEKVFEYDSENNFKMNIKNNEYRIIILTNKIPMPFGARIRIGDYNTNYFTMNSEGYDCIISESLIDEMLKFRIYVYKDNSWILHDSLRIQ